jgi:hypothetical protein
VNKLPVIIILICFLSACNYSRYRHNFFEGNWVLLNYLDTVQKYRSVVKAGDMRMQEIVLKRHTDSVCFFYDGWERAMFPYIEKTSNQVTIPRYFDQEPLNLFINEYAYYLSYDKDSVRHVFVKPDDLLKDSFENPTWPVTTQRVINSLVLGGIYKYGGQARPVQLYTNGNITGLAGYTYYEVCIGGDCRSFYDGDVVYMKKNDRDEYFTWEWKGKDLLIFKLDLVSAPGEKPVYKKGEKQLSLTKLK